MTLQDISTSYRQVQPVTFNTDTGEIIVNDIYNNRARAQQVTTSEPSATDMSTWKVGGQDNTSNQYNWRVNFGKVSPVDPEAHMQLMGGASSDQTNNSDNFMTQTLNKVGKWWDEMNLSQYNLLSKDRLEKAKRWINNFQKMGLSKLQSLALVGNVVAECNFNYNAVNKQELNGKSTNKSTHGWINAGEGLVQFTGWDNKLRLINKYNQDPLRQGPKITTDPQEYARDDSRHISSVSEHDAALFVKYFYEDFLDKQKNASFEDIMGSFYLRKSGNHLNYSQKKLPLIEQAYLEGIYYNNFHNSQSYRQGKQKQSNGFVKALRFSYDLGKELGYFT